jgi:protein involved in polysaccharide export with SLBB domain/SH3-like domain-containing protein
MPEPETIVQASLPASEEVASAAAESAQSAGGDVQSAAERRITVQAERVNIRTAPNTNATVLAQSSKGETFKLVAEIGEWYQIVTVSGASGFIFKALASEEAAVVGADDGGSEPGRTRYVEVTAASVNIRKFPTTSALVVAQALQGDLFELLAEGDDWYKVKALTAVGEYIYKPLAQLLPDGPTDAAHDVSVRHIEIGQSRVNIRRGPNTVSTVVTQGQRGDVLPLVDKIGGWFKVRMFSGEPVFVSASFAEEVLESGTPDAIHSTEARYVEVLVPRANIRTAASQNAPLVGKGQRGDIYRLIDKSDNWCKISTFTGGIGYIYQPLVAEITQEVAGVFEEKQAQAAPQAARKPEAARSAETRTAAAPARFEPPRPASGYILQAGDELDIKFFYNPDLNESLKIRPDGKVSLQLLDEIQAAGLSPAELDEQVTERLGRYVDNPSTSVIVKAFSNQKVYVGGEVNRPGLIPLTGSLHTIQAILQSGGMLDSAQLKNVVIVRHIGDSNSTAFTVDVSRVLKGEPDVLLAPFDIVYVPKTTIAKVDQFVEQYISGIIPDNVIFTFPYNLRPGTNF